MKRNKVRRKQSRRQRNRRFKAYVARFIALLAAIAALILIIYGIIKLFSFLGGVFDKNKPETDDDNTVHNVIVIDKKGGITETSVEDFDTSEYDAEALEKMINDTISEYNGSGEEKISLKTLDIKDGKARAVISYRSAEDYASYNGKTFVIGDVKDLDITGVTLADDKNAVLTHDDMEKVKGKYVLLNDDTRISLPGKVQYVSRNVEKTGKNTADVKKAGTDSVIIYK
ncbi:MAG: hypothetical protein K6F99_07790 [Lachnospiraceae bacterium]|nr:hypothetical protein [Lachnospiraceae bacterium]